MASEGAVEEKKIVGQNFCDLNIHFLINKKKLFNKSLASLDDCSWNCPDPSKLKV